MASQAWDQDAARKPLPPARPPCDESAASVCHLGPHFPRPLRPQVAFSWCTLCGPRATVAPPGPLRGDSGHTPRLCQGSRRFGESFCKHRIRRRPGLCQLKGGWEAVSPPESAGGRVFPKSGLAAVWPEAREQTGPGCSGPVDNRGVASCRLQRGHVRLPKQAGLCPAWLPRRATCGGRWRVPS